MAKKIDWNSHVGERWGKLTIIRPVDVGRGRTGYECRCDCGNVKIVKVYQHLSSGKVKSCGCMARTREHCDIVGINGEYAEHIQDYRRTRRLIAEHRMIYAIWRGMKKRCYEENNHNYYRYGGRGIKVCDEWLNSFCAFCEWSLANGYYDLLQIDRIDVNGDYKPENCRWVTTMANNNNRRNNAYLMDGAGVVHTRAEWIRLGFSAHHVDEWTRTGDLIRVGYDEVIQSRKS